MEKFKILNGLSAFAHIIMLCGHYHIIFDANDFQLENSSKIKIQIFHNFIVDIPYIFCFKWNKFCKIFNQSIFVRRVLIIKIIIKVIIKVNSRKPFRKITLKFYFEKFSSIIPTIYIYYALLKISNNYVFKYREISIFLSENIISKLLFINNTFNIGKNVN